MIKAYRVDPEAEALWEFELTLGELTDEERQIILFEKRQRRVKMILCRLLCAGPHKEICCQGSMQAVRGHRPDG